MNSRILGKRLIFALAALTILTQIVFLFPAKNSFSATIITTGVEMQVKIGANPVVSGMTINGIETLEAVIPTLEISTTDGLKTLSKVVFYINDPDTTSIDPDFEILGNQYGSSWYSSSSLMNYDLRNKSYSFYAKAFYGTDLGHVYETPKYQIQVNRLTISFTEDYSLNPISGTKNIYADVSKEIVSGDMMNFSVSDSAGKYINSFPGTKDLEAINRHYFSWDVSTYTNGTYTLKAMAYKMGGETAEKTISVSVNNTPTITLNAHVQDVASSGAIIGGTKNLVVSSEPFGYNFTGITGKVKKNGVFITNTYLTQYTNDWKGSIDTTTLVNGDNYIFCATGYYNSAIYDGCSYSFSISNATSSDTNPPSIPAGLVATKDDYNEVDLKWSASTDNVGVTGYEVWRSLSGIWSKIGDSSVLSYIDNTVYASTPYYYKIIAYDAAGNRSSPSTPLFLNTPASASVPTFNLSLAVNEVSGNPSKKLLKTSAISTPSGYNLTSAMGKITDSAGITLTGSPFNLIQQAGGYWSYEYDISSLASGNYYFCAKGFHNTTEIPWTCSTTSFIVNNTSSTSGSSGGNISIYPDVMNSTGTFRTLQVTATPAGANLFNVNGKIRKDGAYGVAAFDNIALSFDTYSNSWRKEFDTINLTNGGSYVFCAKASLDSAGSNVMPEVCTGVFVIDNSATTSQTATTPQLEVYFQNITPDALKGDVKISIKTSIEPDIVNFKLQRESGSAAFPAAVKIDATNFYFLWSTAQYYDGNYTIYATAKKGAYERTASVSAYVANYSAATTTPATTTPTTTQTTSSLIITFTDALQPPLSGDRTISISSNQKMDSCKFKVEGSKYGEFQGTNSGMQCSFILPTQTFPDGQYLIRAIASSGANTNEIILYTSFSNQTPGQTIQPVSPMPPQTTNDYYIPQECKDKGYTTPEACQNYMMFPPECRSQNILDPEACKSYMYKYGMPPECQNQGVQTPEQCQKIIFQNSMPPECKTAGATTKEECDKIMSVQFMLTPECKTANITTADACNTYMIEKFSPPECQNTATQEECGYMVRDSYSTFNTLSPMEVNTIFNAPRPATENFPAECKEAQITSPDECKNYMMKLSMPPECREANVTTGEECEKIMFKKFGPKECIDAEIMDPTECEKFMFKKYAPEDCKAAGIFNPEACKKYMFEKYGNGDNIPKDKFPIECQKANAATAEECEKVMKTAYMPKECKDKGITNEGECEKYFEKKYMPPECKTAGASTREECDKAMFKKYAPKECLKAGIEKDDDCQKFMFNLYAPKVKCDNLEDWQCKKNLEERHLGDVVAKQAQFNQIKERSNELIGKSMKVGDIIKSNAFEDDKMIPIANNNESLRIVSTTENMVLNDEDTLTQTGPVAFMIDSDGDELSDDMEKLLGTDPLKEDTDGDGYKDGEETRTGHDPLGPGLLTRTLTPAEKAMVENITLEHPKTSGEISENLTVEKIENLPAGNEADETGYLLSGTSEPDSVLTVYIYSDLPLVLTVKANNEGNWEYQLDRPLAEGEHEIYVAVNDETGKVVNKSKPSSLFIKSAKAVDAAEYLEDPSAAPQEPIEIINSNKYNLIAFFSIMAALSIFGIMLILRKRKNASVK